MANFAVLFVAALAFQATFAEYSTYQTQKNGDVQDLLHQIQYVSQEAISTIQKVDIEEHSHVLYSQANEFAHNIHEVAYHLQHLAHQIEEGQSQELLKQIVKVLSEAVHSIQKAIQQEVNEVKSELESQIQKVATEAQKLVQVIEESTTHHEEVYDYLDDLLTALQQLHVRNNIEYGRQEEVKSYIHSVSNQVVSAIQRVNSGSEDVAEDLIHHARHYGHHLGDILQKIQKEVRSHNIKDEQVQSVLLKVSNNLNQIHSSLHQVGHQEHQHDSLEHDNEHLQRRYWLVHAGLYHTGHHENQDRVPLGIVAQQSHDNYGQHLGQHSQGIYGQTHGSLEHLGQHSQDYGRLHGSLEHLGQHSQGIYGQTHGSLDHLAQHSQDRYDQTHQQSHGLLERLGYPTHDGLEHIHGAYVPVAHQSQDIYGAHHEQGIVGQYPGVVGGIQSSVVKRVVQELVAAVRGVAVQLDHLVELVRPTEVKEHGSHHVRDLVHTVVAHSLVSSRQLQRNVAHTVSQVNHVNHIDQEI